MVFTNIDNANERETWKTMEYLFNSCWYAVHYKDLQQNEAVRQIVSGFTGILRKWWDKLSKEVTALILQGGNLENSGKVISLFFFVLISDLFEKPSSISKNAEEAFFSIRCCNMNSIKEYQKHMKELLIIIEEG